MIAVLLTVRTPLLGKAMVPPRPDARRTRNAAATREAMLAAARRHFARDSYDNVGLREIARDVGVDPALVGRYFGGKEQLFAEAIRGGDEHILTGVTREGLAAHFTTMVLDDSRRGSEEADIDLERIMMLLRSVSSPKASQILRDTIDADIVGPVVELLDGPNPEMRATLCFAVLMGVGIMREAMASDALACEHDDALRTRLNALFTAALAA